MFNTLGEVAASFYDHPTRRNARRDDTFNLTPTHCTQSASQSVIKCANILTLFYANRMGFRWHISTLSVPKLFNSPNEFQALLQNVQSFKIKIIFHCKQRFQAFSWTRAPHYVHDELCNRDKLVTDWQAPVIVTQSFTDYVLHSPDSYSTNWHQVMNMCVNFNNNNFSSKCKAINQKRIVAPTVQ